MVGDEVIAFCNRRSPICNKDFEICSAIPNDRELLSKSQNLCPRLASGGCRMLIFGVLSQVGYWPPIFGY
jgi:hypothetical protein